jgi:hypothetical protein
MMPEMSVIFNQQAQFIALEGLINSVFTELQSSLSAVKLR